MMNFIRKPLIAWIIALASFFSAVTFAIHDAHHYSNKNRQEVTQAVNKALETNCVQGNKLRLVIKQILEVEQPIINKAKRTKSASPSQIAEAQNTLNKEISLVKLRNCSTVTSPLRNAPHP